MSKRVMHFSIVGGAATLVVIGGIFFAAKYRLHRYRAYIESHYQAELALIEHEMQTGKELSSGDTFESVVARDKVRDRIGEMLAGSEFFHASWSSDGHHGNEVLKMMPTGYEQDKLIHCGEGYPGEGNHSHSTYFGRAEDGTKLIIFEGWLQSAWKREYTVAFRRPELDSRMQSKERVQPNGAANRSQPVRPETNRTSAAAGSGR
jgi:hypothetical protein